MPVTVLKHYRTPAFVGPRTLAFAVSYSGDTEETRRDGRAARSRAGATARRDLGGRRARASSRVSRARCTCPCPDGIPVPRLALGALVAPLFVILFRMGMLPEAHAALLRAQQQLARRRDQCRPEVEVARNPARELARRIGRTIPVIYGIGGLGGVAAMRWKQSMNENAKAPAFWNQYPELDHNEVCGWGQHGDVTRQLFTLVELRHGLEHPQLARAAPRRRASSSKRRWTRCSQVEAEGEGRLAQLLDLMYLGDWTSYYLALDNDVDPGPIDAISQLKARLAHYRVRTAGPVTVV